MLPILLQTKEDNKISSYWCFDLFDHANFQRKTENICQVKQTIGINKISLNKCNSVKLHYIIITQY